MAFAASVIPVNATAKEEIRRNKCEETLKIWNMKRIIFHLLGKKWTNEKAPFEMNSLSIRF